MSRLKRLREIGEDQSMSIMETGGEAICIIRFASDMFMNPKAGKKKIHKQESDDYTWGLRGNRLSTTAKGRWGWGWSSRTRVFPSIGCDISSTRWHCAI